MRDLDNNLKNIWYMYQNKKILYARSAFAWQDII